MVYDKLFTPFTSEDVDEDLDIDEDEGEPETPEEEGKNWEDIE